MSFFSWEPPKPTSASREIARLEKLALTLQGTIDVRNCRIRVLEAERDFLCEVLARDRLRVKAEAAAFAEQVATATKGR